MNLRDVRDSLLNEPLAKALLKSKVLASMLHADELRTFVDRELEGYDGKTDIPSFRVTGCGNLGTFRNSRMSVDSHPVPLTGLPAVVREWAEKHEFRESIPALERTIRDADDQIWIPWPHEFVAQIGDVVIDRYVFRCTSASKTISVDALVGVVETVRSRVLDIVLALIEKFPAQVSTEDDLSRIPKEEVRMVVQNFIHGDHASVASGIAVQQAVQVVRGDLTNLLEALRGLGLPESEREALREAIVSDTVDGKPTMGTTVKRWIANLATKAAEKSVELGVTSALPQIIDAVHKFFG
jgi:hypothetical protein